MIVRRPLVSIITVNYNGKKYLNTCFDSLYNLNYPKDKLEIIMVDNCSTDDSISFVKKRFPKVKIIDNDVNNYCKANNLGIKQAKGEYIALINNDIKVDKNWLVESIKVMAQDKTIGAVSSKILFMNGQLQSTGHQEYPDFYWGDRGFKEEDRGQYGDIEEIPSICGCSILYRKSCLDDVGLLDEDFVMYIEDVDMSLRCRKKGWRLLYVPKSIIYHEHHGAVASEELARSYLEKNRLLLVAKHYPKRLPYALFGKGYFSATDNVTKNKDLYNILPKVFSKLIMHHDAETVEKILPDIFDSLRKILNFRNDYLVQCLYAERLRLKSTEQIVKEKDIQILQKDVQLSNLTVHLKQKLQKLKQKGLLLKEKDSQLQEKDKQLRQKDTLLKKKDSHLSTVKNELNAIYSSTGFRFLLRPLWTFIWAIKQKPKNLRRKISCKIKILENRLRENELFVHFYNSDNIVAKLLQKIYRLQNPWLRAYFNHLKSSKNPPTPQVLILMLNKRCDLKCEFCGLFKSSEEMPLEGALHIIDSAGRLGVRTLVITGGEPLLHPDFFKIVEFAKDKNLIVSITTNGTQLKRNTRKITESGIDVLSVSIDGLEKIHDELRGVTGTYKKVMDGIEELRSLGLGPRLAINLVVNSRNVGELEAVYKLCKSKGIFFDFWPVNNYPDLYLSNGEDIETFLRFINSLRRKREIPRSKYDYYINSLNYHRNGPLRIRCLGLARQFGIDVDGNILPCCFWNGNIKWGLGNVFKDDLQRLWHSERYFKVRQDIFQKGCGENCYNHSLYEFSSITGLSFLVQK